MKRRILSVAIAILILTVSVIPGLSALAAGTVPTLSGGVYQIGTASELIWFADAVNSGSQSIKGKLTADIQLNAPGSVANKWTPIGTQASPFCGTFDGDGHTVSGVYVDSGIDCAGFFGSVVIPSNTSGDADAPDKMTSEYVLQHTQTSIKNIKIFFTAATASAVLSAMPRISDFPIAPSREMFTARVTASAASSVGHTIIRLSISAILREQSAVISASAASQAMQTATRL